MGSNSNNKLLRRLACKVLGVEKAKKVWSRIEIIGDIAVIRKSPDISIAEIRKIAEELINKITYVKSVWCATSEVKGAFRLREYVHLAGQRKSETTYVEHGCKFKLDITKVYISPALNYEHKRVASMVKPGETIVNMFAGIGLFSIIIAKTVKHVKIYSIDINPYAYKYMVENVMLNKVENYVIPILGDSAEVISEKLINVADRVLMPLPELAISYLRYAILSMKNKGFLHTYLFIRSISRRESLEKAHRIYAKELEKYVKDFELIFSRVIRSVGPRKYQVVLDYYVKK